MTMIMFLIVFRSYTSIVEKLDCYPTFVHGRMILILPFISFCTIDHRALCIVFLFFLSMLCVLKFHSVIDDYPISSMYDI